MKIKLLNYEHLSRTIPHSLKSMTYSKPSELVSRLATMTACPVVVVAYYLSLSTGITDDLKEMILDCFKFYNYTGIEDLDEFYSKYSPKQ